MFNTDIANLRTGIVWKIRSVKFKYDIRYNSYKIHVLMAVLFWNINDAFKMICEFVYASTNSQSWNDASWLERIQVVISIYLKSVSLNMFYSSFCIEKNPNIFYNVIKRFEGCRLIPDEILAYHNLLPVFRIVLKINL